MNFDRLFPTLTGKNWADVNLDAEARAYAEYKKFPSSSQSKNPFLDPTISQNLVEWAARKNQKNFTYGGYLEDRGFLNGGSYMEKDQRFLHLGVDYNVPTGTPVSSPVEAIVHTIDDDFPDACGWGPRIIVVTHDQRIAKHAVIFGHLQNIQVRVGDKIISGTVIAEIGAPPRNGNWFPHLHLQRVETSLYEKFENDGAISKIDGYACRVDREKIPAQYPDPIALQQI